MITVEQMLTFGLAAFIIIVIPGPSVVFTIGRALAYGRGVALATVVGNTIGLVTIVALVALGLGVVVQDSIVVFTALKLVGAAYLVWLGFEAVRHRRDFLASDGAELLGGSDDLDPRDPAGVRRRRVQPQGLHDAGRRPAAVRRPRRGAPPAADAAARPARHDDRAASPTASGR